MWFGVGSLWVQGAQSLGGVGGWFGVDWFRVYVGCYSFLVTSNNRTREAYRGTGDWVGCLFNQIGEQPDSLESGVLACSYRE